MTRHSKNNTANSVFSKAEYDKLKAHYGTQRALLGSNSHRAFNACSLCLSKAVNPVSCSKGHLFCKECVMKDLLSQRDGLARKKQEIEAIRKEEEAARDEVRLKARERVLSGNTASLFGKRKERDEAKDANVEGEPATKRRKFEFDKEAAEKLAQEAEEEAIRQLELEQNEARKSRLPAFWLPSLTPESKSGLGDYWNSPECYPWESEMQWLLLLVVALVVSGGRRGIQRPSKALLRSLPLSWSVLCFCGLSG